MGRWRFNRNFRVATAVVAAVIVYGSLYPFAFRQPVDGLGPAARALLDSWAEPPGRGDFIGNVLLYIPFGFFAILSISRSVGTATRVVLVILTGAFLSACVELVQYYDDGRVTEATDVYANVSGTMLGALGGSITGANFRWPLLREIAANHVPTLLLSAWAGYRLFPYVPTLDLHKYWHALKPVILHPSLTGYDLFRYTAIWLTVGALIEAIGESKRQWLLFPLFVGSVLVAKVLVIDATLTIAEISGAALALCSWVVLTAHARLRTTLIALLFCGYVIAERVEPFQFSTAQGAFGWVPFLAFMNGSLEINILSFLQKFFLFGSSIWLLGRVGLRLWASTAIVAVILFLTSQAEIYLPHRSAEITDAVMALIIGALFALLQAATRRNELVAEEPRRDLHVAVFERGTVGQPIAASKIVAPVGIKPGEPRLAPRGNTPSAPQDSGHSGRAATLTGLGVAAICLPLTAVIAANYPLAPWFMGAGLTVYAMALWRWPSLWLAVLPALLPAFDLTPWTGWTLIGEPDLFVLLTVGILAPRAPPRRADFFVRGLPAAALVLTVVSYLASVALGLALPGPEGGSDNPYLRPDNAIRLAKGFFAALALLPFLRQRMRTRGDTMAWLGAGMVAGMALVAAAALAERIVFTGPFDFTTDYRVVATFSGMNIGGGYIGAYFALSLPFLLVFTLRPRAPALIMLFAVAIAAGYALVVTFARAAYGAAAVSITVACLGWSWAAYRRHRSAFSSLAVLSLGFLLVGGLALAAFDTGFMAERLRRIVPDLALREGNWAGGLALRDDDIATTVFGMGLGTYPRVLLARKPDDRFPTNFAVGHDGGYAFLSLRAGSATYVGQKVPIASGQQYRLFLALRSPEGPEGGGALTVMLCEKLLLYSARCRNATFQPPVRGIWQDFGAAISTAGFDPRVVLGFLKRPVELSFFNPTRGTTIEVGHIRMLDPQDRDFLANGDFSRGTERWYFTDDDYILWRIHSQFFESLFETGVLGLIALILLTVTALVGGARALGRGDSMAAAVIGSLVAFLLSGLFDNLLEVPRLGTLFYIVAFTGLTMMPAPARKQASAR